MAIIKKSPVKKAQNGAKTKDSTAHFKKMQDFHYKQASTAAEFGLRSSADEHMRSATKAVKDQFRQGNKGRSGYDKNGYPVKKKMKVGGVINKAQNGATSPKANYTAEYSDPKPLFDKIKKTKDSINNVLSKKINERDSSLKKYRSAIEKFNQAKSRLPKKKAGGMIKRADGSMSKRGLWDNIRANKGSGKKPTAAMLKQEKKIKAKAKK
jgi:hypothetical protein